jgi:regulator of protease activity HflC (stomatin/prohibitin superfamily)
MQALIDFIIRNLLQLWPIARVYEWQVAIMVRRGKIHRSLSPGLHWRWWFFDEARTYPAAECVVALAAGALTTADGRSIVVDGNIGYRMVDMARNYRACWNIEKSLAGLAAGVLCSELAQRHWPALAGVGRVQVENELKARLNRETESWGIEISRVHLVACVEARQHRHFVDGSLTR